jgi:hypothetical protein
VTRVRDAFEVDLGVRDVFTAPTVAQLGEVVVRKLTEEIEGLSEEEAQRHLKGAGSGVSE